MNDKFLPVSRKDLKQLGWKELDIILVTGEAYVDHPAYGAAVIGRVLENAGFKIGIIAQPDWRKRDDFRKLGQPRLFFGVTAGNLDSMVANYTANKRPRKNDAYSPGGQAGLRPDRATIVYTNRIKEAFPTAVVVLGGIEASLRRLAHYDYWDNSVRRSILLDAKADILVYGMGEKQILKIASHLAQDKKISTLPEISGTTIVRNSLDDIKGYVTVPPFEEVKENPEKFNSAFKIIYAESDPYRGKTIVQKHANRFVIQFPPAVPLTSKELDEVYLLNYTRQYHPLYKVKGKVPSLETVRFSLISHRGCCGGCSFCSLSFHQGRIIQSRSKESILKEVDIIANHKNFKGTITDIGGPTANLYQAECSLWQGKGSCKNKSCLFPEKCSNLKLGYKKILAVWRGISRNHRVKHLFISSGLRYDLLLKNEARDYLETLCRHHISGQLKVAPEHVTDSVLSLMRKPSLKKYELFAEKFKKLNQNKKQYLVNYFICSHPGSSLKQALELALYLRRRKINPEQVQDYIPLPLTISGCMYYTGRDPLSGKKVYVAKTFKERKMQRALLQSNQPRNRKLVIAALKELKREDLKKVLLENKLFIKSGKS